MTHNNSRRSTTAAPKSEQHAGLGSKMCAPRVHEYEMSILDQSPEMYFEPDSFSVSLLTMCKPEWVSPELFFEVTDSLRGFTEDMALIIADDVIDCWSGLGLHITGYRHIDDLLGHLYSKILACAFRKTSNWSITINNKVMDNTENKTKKIRVRGTGCYDPVDNSFDFTPFNEGPSSQANVKNCKGGGKSWETTGSDPSKMLCLKTKLSSADQYSDLLTQFNALTRDLKPQKPVAMPSELRVVKEPSLQCWLDEQKGELTYTGVIDLNKNPRTWQAEVLKQVQLVVRRLPASDKFNRIINNIKKSGGQNHV